MVCYSINTMKNKMKATNWTSYYEVKNAHMGEIKRLKRQIRYCEWIISASVGASIALGFVIAHQMIVTEWTW